MVHNASSVGIFAPGRLPHPRLQTQVKREDCSTAQLGRSNRLRMPVYPSAHLHPSGPSSCLSRRSARTQSSALSVEHGSGSPPGAVRFPPQPLNLGIDTQQILARSHCASNSVWVTESVRPAHRTASSTGGHRDRASGGYGQSTPEVHSVLQKTRLGPRTPEECVWVPSGVVEARSDVLGPSVTGFAMREE